MSTKNAILFNKITIAALQKTTPHTLPVDNQFNLMEFCNKML